MLRTRVHWRVTPLTTAARFMTAKARKQAPRWEQPGLLRASLLTQNQGRGGWGVSLGASLVAQMAKKLPVMPETQVQSLGREDPLEKGLATHSSILAWEIPWTEGPGGLLSMESQRVGLSWATDHSTQHTPWGGKPLCSLQDANSTPGFGPLDAGSFFPAPVVVKFSQHCRMSPGRTESPESVWWRACSTPSPAACTLRELLPLGPHHTQRRGLFFLPRRRCR